VYVPLRINDNHTLCLVNMNTPIHQSPHEYVSEEVLENESGDELLLLEEVDGVGGGSLGQVVEAQESRGQKVK